jgi:hypothetical protein
MIVNGKFERMWKEAVVAYVKVLSQHFRGGSEENHERSVDNLCQSHD